MLADALPEFAAQAACKPQAAGKPQATSSASNVISHPFPVTGLLPRTSLQTPAPRDSNHCGGQCPSSPTQVAGLDLQHLANALARQSRLPNAALKRNNSKGCGASVIRVARCFPGERRWRSVMRVPERLHLPAPDSWLDVVRASCSGTADTTAASAVAVSTAGSAAAAAAGSAAAATLADGPAAAALADGPVLACSLACK